VRARCCSIRYSKIFARYYGFTPRACQLIHVPAGPNARHKGAFVTIAKAIGFKAPWTTTPATPELIERLNGLVVNLGPYPYAAIDRSSGGDKR
jgi:hypothetical protein